MRSSFGSSAGIPVSSGGFSYCHTGFTFLQNRFRQQSDILPGLVSELFPSLVNIASRLLSSPPPNASQEIPHILHLILKTYKTSVVIHLSAHQQGRESLMSWGNLLFQVVNLQIPPDAVPEDEEERERSEMGDDKAAEIAGAPRAHEEETTACSGLCGDKRLEW